MFIININYKYQTFFNFSLFFLFLLDHENTRSLLPLLGVQKPSTDFCAETAELTGKKLNSPSSPFPPALKQR